MSGRGLRRAVFLDRDGTLNVDPGYIADPAQIEIYLGVVEGLRLLSEKGFLLIVVTNQSGISRKFYTHEIVGAIHARIQSFLEARGVRIDAFYYCPHHPDEKCACRKPGTALFERASEEHSLDLASSAIIGNGASDIEAGRRLGLLTVYVPTPRFRLEREPVEKVGADLVAESFREACRKVAERLG